MPLNRNSSKHDRDRLNAALKTLPAPLVPLRPIILSVGDRTEADIDSEDTNAAAFDAIAALPNLRATAKHYHTWLAGLPRARQHLLLRAFDGILRSAATSPRPRRIERPKPRSRATGFRRLSLTIPRTFKTDALYAGGIQISDRAARLLIGELDAKSFVRQSGRQAYLDPAEMITPPHLRREFDRDVRLGRSMGTRLTTRHTKTGLPATVHYLLTLDRVHFTVGLFSRQSTGVDTAPYESLIAKIRSR